MSPSTSPLGVMNTHVSLRRATTAMYSLLTLLPAATLALFIFEPPRLPPSYVFTSPASRSVALLLCVLTIGSLLLAVLVPRAKTCTMARWLLIPGAGLVGVAFGWAPLIALLYVLGLLFLFSLSVRPSTHDA